MQFQTFRANDVTTALQQVKATFGPNALIESTRTLPRDASGSSWVEVVASAPRQHGSGGAPTEVRRRSPRVSARPTRAHEVAPRVQGEVERELAELRALVDEIQAARPPRERAVALLHTLGIEGALARDLASGATRAAKGGRAALAAWLRQRVASRLAVQPGLIARPVRQLIAVVGTAGVGKTTTLAKLAARARLDLGRSVAVISLDHYRVGAVEQWQRYATLLGVPFRAPRDPHEFERALGEVHADLVLVDTPGRSQADEDDDWLLGACLEKNRTHHAGVQLVLPAWLRASDAERVASSYEDCSPTGVIVTKLDEAEVVGGPLHAALPRRLPLTYLCDGPRVPEDLHDATAATVLSALFPEEP